MFDGVAIRAIERGDSTGGEVPETCIGAISWRFRSMAGDRVLGIAIYRQGWQPDRSELMERARYGGLKCLGGSTY